MATTSYKCPGCGAGIHYKPALKKFKCDFCLSEYTEDEIDGIYKDKAHNHTESKYNDNIEKDLHYYNCNSCGAEVVTDKTTTSTFCYYCHNPVILSNRLVGDFRPNKMIPFSIDKEKAKSSFMKWAANKKFVPKDFTSTSQLEKITGVYLPYWWVDAKADIDYVGEGRNVRVWRSNGREYTETKKYQIVRQGQIDLNNVGEFAFTKIDKGLINGIGPYRENEAEDFSMPYLSGFFAEQYDVDKQTVEPMIEGQINRYYSYLVSEMVNGYDQVSNVKTVIDINIEQWNYTLLLA